MRALHIHAGPKAMAHLAQHGLSAGDVGTIPGAAGGPKGLILGPLDRFIFGQWLPQSSQPVHLVGASIGAWRLATACMDQPVAALKRFESAYVGQHFEALPGEKRPPADRVSAVFGQNLRWFYDGHVDAVLNHPRYVLHLITSHGRGLLAQEQGLRTALGYFGAFVSNLASRRALGLWLQRVVFSSGNHGLPALPFDPSDHPTQQVALTKRNFFDALQASCSIPFVLQAVHGIDGAPAGAHWDGGVTDYHLHLNYAGAAQCHQNAINSVASNSTGMWARGQKTSQDTAISSPLPNGVPSPASAGAALASAGLVLYPHFQRSVVPGWLDKHLRWRHGPSAFLDTMVLLAPNPEWVATLPNHKLPDRHDFTHYGANLAARTLAWQGAISASAQLADEFAQWLERPDMRCVQPL